MSYIINRDTKVYVSTVNENFNTFNTRMFKALRGIEYNVPSGITNHARRSIQVDQKRSTTPYTQTVSRVTFSIPIYFRPIQGSLDVDCVERYFWESFSGGDSNLNSRPGDFTVSFQNSRVAQLPFIQIFLQYGNKIYKFEDCIVEAIDTPININGITRTVVRGTARAFIEPEVFPEGNNFIGWELEEIAPTKLTTVELLHEGSSYVMPLTGGSFRLDNNVQYNERREVGKPTMFKSHFTGSLTGEGFLNAYLRVGDSTRTANFLSERIAEVRDFGDTFEESFSDLSIRFGGAEGASVEYKLGDCLINIPNFSNTNVVGLTFQVMVRNTENIEIIYRLN